MKRLSRVVVLSVNLSLFGSASAVAEKLPYPYHATVCTAGGRHTSVYELPAEIMKHDYVYGKGGEEEMFHISFSRDESTGKLRMKILGHDSESKLGQFKSDLPLNVPKTRPGQYAASQKLKPDSGLSFANEIVERALKEKKGISFDPMEDKFKCYTHLNAKVEGAKGNLTCFVCTNYVQDLQTVIDGGAITIAPEEKSEAAGAQ